MIVDFKDIISFEELFRTFDAMPSQIDAMASQADNTHHDWLQAKDNNVKTKNHSKYKYKYIGINFTWFIFISSCYHCLVSDTKSVKRKNIKEERSKWK